MIGSALAHAQVATPGRLLQHMDETASFSCASVLLLVLDEADRILDMGFEKAINAILEVSGGPQLKAHAHRLKLHCSRALRRG